jgi:hypothetical protein
MHFNTENIRISALKPEHSLYSKSREQAFGIPMIDRVQVISPSKLRKRIDGCLHRFRGVVGAEQYQRSWKELLLIPTRVRRRWRAPS